MKKIIAIPCLLLAVSLTASAQNSQLTLRKGDYRMDGNLVVTNDSILQRIQSERFDAIRLETPHNGFKLLKSHYWRGQSEEPADCDGTFVVEKDGLAWLRDGNRMSIYRRWHPDYLFQNAKEMITVDVRLTDFGMYYPRGEDDTATTHPYPATAIAFDYADDDYYIPISDSVPWNNEDATIHDSVHLTISIQRDRRGPHGESPYTEVVALERIRVPGEVDTIGRFVCYNGDTVCFTNLHLRKPLLKKMLGRFFKYVQYYDRGNRQWTVKYYRTTPKDLGAQGEWPSDPYTIYLQERRY